MLIFTTQMDSSEEPTLSLLQWLENLDLEEYHDKLLNLGVKKVKHVKECNRDHLTKIGMLELEIERFLKCASRKEEDQTTFAHTSAQEKVTLKIHMPSSSFGQSRLDVSEDSLKKEYFDLWYTNPQNFKQRSSNSFILNMCASARWQFASKRKLIDWARKERDFRWNIMLAFANEEEVATESLYFKDQCIRSRITKLKSEYKDFLLLTELDSVKETKYARVLQSFEEAKDLKNLFELAEEKLQERYQQVVKKAGGTEEEEFIKKMRRVGQELSGEVEAFFGRVLRVNEKYVRVLGDNIVLKQKEKKRKQKQNKRKTESRTRAAKKMCLSKGSTSSLATDEKQPTLLRSFTLQPRIPSPAPFYPAPLIPCRLWKQL